MQTLWFIVLFIVIVYVGFAAFLFIFQAKLLFFPDRVIVDTPRSAGLDYDSVTLITKDNIKISAWYVPAPSGGNDRGTILFCHGNAGNISHRIELIKIFHDLGLNVLIFDYRGYGESEGKPSEKGMYRDVDAAWDFLIKTKNTPENRIIIVGRSLGGAIGAYVAQNRNPKGLILDSTFVSVKDLGAELYRFIPVRWMSRFSFNTVKFLRNVSVPVLVIHSRNDDVVPFHHGQRVYESAQGEKSFLEISGLHNDGYLTSSNKYTEGIDSFISQSSK